MEEGWNDKVARLAADRARPEVMLSCALVISGTPRSDTLEAEDMITAVKHAELPTRGQNISEANLALSIILSII